VKEKRVNLKGSTAKAEKKKEGRKKERNLLHL
jgi:hypothetical protein